MTLRDPPLGASRSDALVRFEPPSEPERIDLPAVFGDDRPVELEIGVGKGRFLLLAATAQPDVNFLGIEYARRYWSQAVDRIGKRGLTNVRLMLGEAASLVASRLENESIAACHVYFPDPWPKKRHHKRRFFRPAVIDEVARVLKCGGLLRAVTDHPDYALAIRDVMDGHRCFEASARDDALWALPGMGDYTLLGVTNFEIKYRREGRPIHRFAWRRL